MWFRAIFCGLKVISVKDLKSHFEFSNGKVLVKPFDFKVKDMDLQVGGMHGFDQSIDYIIAMKVPRKYLGNQGNALINSMATQAASKGIPVSLGEVVDLSVRMGGSITNPVLKTDLKQAAGDASKELKQQAVNFVQQKTDSARQVVKDSLTVVKKQVVGDVKDELAKQLLGTKDSTGKCQTPHPPPTCMNLPGPKPKVRLPAMLSPGNHCPGHRRCPHPMQRTRMKGAPAATSFAPPEPEPPQRAAGTYVH